MLYLILSIIALGMLAAAIGGFRSKKTGAPPPETITPDCCGQHEVCARDHFRAALSRPVIYYDDESLDNFRGTGSDAYTEEEANEFREVLYTLQSGEVSPWLHSLQVRGINLPDSLKAEAFLLVGEQQKQA